MSRVKVTKTPEKYIRKIELHDQFVNGQIIAKNDTEVPLDA